MPPWDRYAQTPQQPAQQAPQASPMQQAPAVQQGGQDQIVRPAQGPDPIALENLRIRQEAADRATQNANRDAQGNPGVGYRIGPDGNAEFIPGGPADPAVVNNGNQGNAVPMGAATRAETDIGAYTALSRVLGGFQDDFGGNTITGDLENKAQAYLGVGTPGQSEWWADFRTLDNQIRNDLFGATLTPSEQRAYAQTSIDPAMTPDKIRSNLQRRVEVVRGALARRRDFYIANGYREDAVNALFQPLLEGEFASSQEGQQDRAPPALNPGPGAPPPDGGPTAPPVGPPGDGRILGNVHDGGDTNQAQGIATERFRRADNPAIAGIRDEYAQRLQQGQSAEQIVRYLRDAGAVVNSELVQSVREQVQYRAEHPDVPIGEYDTSQLDDQFIPVDPLVRGLGNLTNLPLGTYLSSAADAVTGFNLDSIIGATGGNAEQARAAMNESANNNPISSAVGNISGGAMTALAAEAGLARAGVTAAVPRALAADTAYGAAAGAGLSDYAADGSPATVGDRLTGAAGGAVAGLVGSAVGQKAGNALAGMARGVTNPAAAALRSEGVTGLTVGQSAGTGRVGRAIRGVEERLSGVPYVGDMINARRAEGVRQFNTAAFNKALEPISGSVGELVGEEAVGAAQEQVSEAFTRALAGKGAVPDGAFADDLLASVETARKRLDRSHPELVNDIGEIFAPFSEETMLSGEALQIISRELRDMKSAYAADPRSKVIGNTIDRVERAVFDLFDRQASGTVPEYNAARQAYRRLAILEDATMKARNREDRVFTPAQLGTADQANTRRFGGRRAAARGDTPFYELQTAGQEVLPNKVPDSGTAGRLLVPLALVGAGGGADAATGLSGQGVTLGAILAGLYTRQGQRLLTKPARGMAEYTRRRALMESERTRRALQLGGAGASGALTVGQQ